MPLVATARVAIERAAGNAGVFLSPVTAWEAALLVAKGRIRLPQAPLAWFEEILQRPGIRLAPLDASVAVDSASLPGLTHGDPADRFLIATARRYDLSLVTRDRKILAYAETGALNVLRC